MSTRTINIDVKDYAAYMKRVATQKVEPALRRGVLSGALRCIPILHKSTQTAPPANPSGKGTGGAFNYGQYMRSWKSVPTTAGVCIFNDAPQAGVIELGRRPGARMPPADPDVMAHWAQRRLGLKPAEAKSLSFVLRRAIAQRGLLPRRVMARAWPAMDKAVHAEVIRELKAAY